jgi:hypothetical protein
VYAWRRLWFRKRTNARRATFLYDAARMFMRDIERHIR